MIKKGIVLSLSLCVLLLLIGTISLLRGYRRDQATRTLLLAIKANQTERALAALEANADPNAQDQGEETVSFTSYLSLLWRQLQGWRLPPVSQGQSALGIAVEQNNTTLVQALLDRGGRDFHDTLKVTYTRNTEVSAPLVMAAVHNKNIAMAQALARHGWDVNAPAEDGSTALFAANDAATVQALVACGAKIGAINKNQHTALDTALLNHSDSAAAALVDLGAYDADALTEAVIHGDLLALQTMFRHHWRLDDLGGFDDGAPPLTVALEVSYARSAQAILLLIRNGADVNKPDRYGRTPLMFLASCGGNPELMPSYPMLMQAFLAHGARVNAQDAGGMTPLMYAAFCRNDALIRILLQHGAQVNRRTKKGETALDCAYDLSALIRGNEAEAIRLLKAAGGKRSYVKP